MVGLVVPQLVVAGLLLRRWTKLRFMLLRKQLIVVASSSRPLQHLCLGIRGWQGVAKASGF